PAVDRGLAAAYLFDNFDHFPELHAVVIAKVDYLEGRLVIVNGRGHSLNNIIYIGIIAAAVAIAVNRNRVALENIPGELVDRQVGSLPGAVNGKETQGDKADAV